jgi:hypothetical protein
MTLLLAIVVLAITARQLAELISELDWVQFQLSLRKRRYEYEEKAELVR